ncbi:MAG: deoxyribonuclease [Actinobacteria bacterium]|nr:MAG: deoxyribonuclease [Actinomycetota bacterium]
MKRWKPPRKKIRFADLFAIGIIIVLLRNPDLVLARLPNTETIEALRALPVRDTREEIPSYNREVFGQRWEDSDHNGCDTRNDILGRDLSRPVFKAGTRDCVVVSGVLAEPYLGGTVDFVRGEDTSPLIQIDHVVALGDAWRAGAWQWDGQKRTEFANDPRNLLAVDGQANQDKGASRADQWLPPNESFHCDYVSRQIAVKSAWGLSVTRDERDAMILVLDTCQEPQD